MSVWDRTAQANLAPAPIVVDVAIGEPIALARRFDPVSSDDESQRWTNPHRISINLAGAPVVLRLTPEGVSPEGGGKGGGGVAAGRPAPARALSVEAIAGSSKDKQAQAPRQEAQGPRQAAQGAPALLPRGPRPQGARRHGRRRASRSATWKPHGGCASRRRG